MYTLDIHTGFVIRDSDGKQVAPCQSAEDPDFLIYQEWANSGGEPTIIAHRYQSKLFSEGFKRPQFCGLFCIYFMRATVQKLARKCAKESATLQSPRKSPRGIFSEMT